jgi:hypothetical protein
LNWRRETSQFHVETAPYELTSTRSVMANLCTIPSGVHLKPSASSVSKLQVRFCWGALALALCCVVSLCFAQDHDVLCSDGSGSFQAEFNTGVTVQVRASTTGELATRACEATLGWNKNSLIVATNASQIDVDTFGVDLGLGVPIATFQVKKSSNECCMKYQVYSLEKPPRLLRTVTGGDFFSAADTDLDGRLEIWTNDAAAIEGFENLGPAELDAVATIVLRFANCWTRVPSFSLTLTVKSQGFEKKLTPTACAISRAVMASYRSMRRSRRSGYTTCEV